jgi:hypothetical protein
MHDYVPASGFDASQAHAEGWGLYSALTDNGFITDLREAPGAGRFADEILAREHVAARILGGDPYHAEVVRHLRRTDIDGYKVFREEHPQCAPLTDIDALF